MDEHVPVGSNSRVPLVDPCLDEVHKRLLDDARPKSNQPAAAHRKNFGALLWEIVGQLWPVLEEGDDPFDRQLLVLWHKEMPNLVVANELAFALEMS